MGEQPHQFQGKLPAAAVVEQVEEVVDLVAEEQVGIPCYHHLLMGHQELLLQLRNIGTLPVGVVDIQHDLDPVEEVTEVLPQEIQEPLILEVEADRGLEDRAVLAVRESSLFNIQNKEVKSYGTLCTDWL
jgi:hypothetical protein